MASEAPVSGQKVDELVGDVEGIDEVKNETENIKVDDFTVQATDAAEPQMLEEKKSDALATEVDKDELKGVSSKAESSIISEEMDPHPSVEAHTTETEEKQIATLSAEESKKEPEDQRPDVEASVEAEQKEISTENYLFDSPKESTGVDTAVPEEKQYDTVGTGASNEETKDESQDSEPDQKEIISVDDSPDIPKPSKETVEVLSEVEATVVQGKESEKAKEKLEEKQDDTVGTGEIKDKATEESQDVKPPIESEQKKISTYKDFSNTPGPSNEAVQVPSEVEATVAQEAERERVEEPAEPETVTGEVQGTSEVPEVQDAIVDTTKEKNADGLSTAPSLEVPLSNGKKESIIDKENVRQNIESESLASVDPTESNESKPNGVVSEVPAEEVKPNDDALGNKEEVVSADDEVQTTDIIPASDAEGIQVSDETSFTKPEDNTESDVNTAQGKQEKPAEAEKTSVPETTEAISIKEAADAAEDAIPSGTNEVITNENDGTLEGEGAPVVETSRDIDLGGVESKVEQSAKESVDSLEEKTATKQTEAKETLLDKFVKEGSEEKKKEETENVEKEGKTDGYTEASKEVPKEEIPVKTSSRHSNNILSKMKQSFIKVKKAVTGKSPNSKSIASELKEDSKEE